MKASEACEIAKRNRCDINRGFCKNVGIDRVERYISSAAEYGLFLIEYKVPWWQFSDGLDSVLKYLKDNKYFVVQDENNPYKITISWGGK